ncbi:hypothetical protein E3P86_00009 [Wallemia ichthyophaga]|uniref:Uncharacterized protein n=1 Tax=Wallemia ichthyophaga TaxID=245174 RepID=A0A4T0JLT0_WALIC|nr:hypothetical protein E3P86_00009 [Wallemia ichthyophaga]
MQTRKPIGLTVAGWLGLKEKIYTDATKASGRQRYSTGCVWRGSSKSACGASAIVIQRVIDLQFAVPQVPANLSTDFAGVQPPNSSRAGCKWTNRN